MGFFISNKHLIKIDIISFKIIEFDYSPITAPFIEYKI